MADVLAVGKKIEDGEQAAGENVQVGLTSQAEYFLSFIKDMLYYVYRR
jgi:hypothetical protein